MRKFLWPLIVVVVGCGSKEKSNTQGTNDYNVALTITKAIGAIYNANLVGKPAGTISLTASCPISGSVVISGTSSVSGGTTEALDLTYLLQTCVVAAGDYRLSLAGTVSETGTMDANNAALSFRSTGQVGLTGFVNNGIESDFTEDCEFGISQTSTSIGGLLCGRDVKQ